MVAFGLGACETTPPQQDAAIWNKPPRYGHGGTQAGERAANAEKKNRFGFGGDPAANEQNAQAGNTTDPAGSRFGAGSPNTPPADGKLGSTPGAGNVAANDAKKDEKKKDAGKKGGDSKSNPPSKLKSYPFGKPVPGKGGFVTLPSPHDGLGEIDVRGIAPGTPVEIPDPTKPGKKIYFRVP